MGKERPDVALKIEELPGMRWMKALVAEFTRSDGQPGRWEGISGGDGILVMAFTSWELILVRQFRPLVDSFSMELPGVVYQPGESPEAAVIRGLRGETGYMPIFPEKIKKIGDAWLWNGKSNAEVRIFDAGECRKVAEPFNDDPVKVAMGISVIKLAFAEVLGRMVDGDPEFRDPTLGHALLLHLRRHERIIP